MDYFTNQIIKDADEILENIEKNIKNAVTSRAEYVGKKDYIAVLQVAKQLAEGVKTRETAWLMFTSGEQETIN